VPHKLLVGGGGGEGENFDGEGAGGFLRRSSALRGEGTGGRGGSTDGHVEARREGGPGRR
jgi:hypothetical protein